MIRAYKIGLNFLFVLVVLLANVFIECAKPGDSYKSIVDPNLKRSAHAVNLPCYDPFLDDSIIGITVDSLIKRIGKANAYGVKKDTLYFSSVRFKSFT
jgi:hypothetical protein